MKYLIIILAIISLGACSMTPKNNGELKPSPCACLDEIRNHAHG